MQAARSALRRLASSQVPTKTGKQVRKMSGAVSHEEEVKQMNLWRNCTIAAIPLCIGVAIYDLSNAHAHEHEGPQYPYMHIRTKDYPWGACTLFDQHCWAEQKKGHEEEE